MPRTRYENDYGLPRRQPARAEGTGTAVMWLAGGCGLALALLVVVVALVVCVRWPSQPPDPPGWEGWSDLAGRWEARDTAQQLHYYEFNADHTYKSVTYDLHGRSPRLVTNSGRVTRIEKKPYQPQNGPAEPGVWHYSVFIEYDLGPNEVSRTGNEVFRIGTDRRLQTFGTFGNFKKVR